MPADFPNFDAPELPRQRVKLPIDYRSRNAKLRLFVAVAAVILVLALAERARDPASWNWLFGLKDKAGNAEKPINNRIARTEATSTEPETEFPHHGKEKGQAKKPAAAESSPGFSNRAAMGIGA